MKNRYPERDFLFSSDPKDASAYPSGLSENGNISSFV